MQTQDNTIGMVLGTEDATPLQFWFAVKDNIKVQLDDMIVVSVQDPEEPENVVRFYGVVDEVRRRYEGVQFDGDTELVSQGLMPANVAYAAHVLVTRVTPEDFIPPGPGDKVEKAVGEHLEKALYVDSMDAPLPAGVLRNGEAGFINYDFINGQKGAHINISGISGIATKTSYALFLLYSIFNAKKRNSSAPLLSGSQLSKAIIFNVKGQDLLYLDKPNKSFDVEEQKWMTNRKFNKNRYEICNLPVAPFESCEMHAPAKEGVNLMADVDVGTSATPYVWTLHTFCAERLLSFVFVDKDAMTNLGFLMAHVEERLAKLAENQRGPHLEVEPYKHHLLDESEAAGLTAFDSSEVLSEDAIFDESRREELRGSKERLSTFDDLVSFLEVKLLLQDAGEDDGKGGDRAWTANQARATREAFIRRLRGAAKYVRRLVRGDLSAKAFERGRIDILNSEKQLHVVDIHGLPPLAQMFVVGVLLRQVFTEQETRQRGQVFVVLDELNKYAPAEGSSPIKDVLLDIAERGRSMGIILIGAQQTASEVERRIVSNAAIRITGRLDAAEAERAEYKFMPATFRLRSTILAPGTMIVHQPDVPSPMMLNFPFPAWATRKKEVNEVVSDEEALDILG